jgi:2-C-methyl-D-erythritol 4-phosphate cytidylyltransferase
VKKSCILVAGGSSSRFGGDTPKQFALLKGRPVLLHALEKFAAASDDVVIVLPANRTEEWRSLCLRYGPVPVHRVVTGGDTRTASVRNGLAVLDGTGVVAVHDGARPLVSPDLIARVYETALAKGSAVPVIDVHSALRRITPEGHAAADRREFRLVQTPQAFAADTLIAAYAAAGDVPFDDDATLFEQAGHSVVLVPGEPENIKITTASDLAVAETLMGPSTV